MERYVEVVVVAHSRMVRTGCPDVVFAALAAVSRAAVVSTGHRAPAVSFHARLEVGPDIGPARGFHHLSRGDTSVPSDVLEIIGPYGMTSVGLVLRGRGDEGSTTIADGER